jgi:hypothetical protein
MKISNYIMARIHDRGRRCLWLPHKSRPPKGVSCYGSRLSGSFALCVFAVGLSATIWAAQTPSSTTPTLEQQLGAEVDRFVEADRVSPPAPCQVLFVGSSSIVNWRDTLAVDMAPMPVINADLVART